MNKKGKYLILAAIVIAAIAIFSPQNSDFFQGQLSTDLSGDNPDFEFIPPDLTASLKINYPEKDQQDIEVEATIKNIGQGDIRGITPFEYTIYINDQLVINNVDSYSTMRPGDEFSFNYPISRAIYNYPDQGTVKIIVDSLNSLKETNEDNNNFQIEYNLK